METPNKNRQKMPSEEFIEAIQKLEAEHILQLNTLIHEYAKKESLSDREATLILMGYVSDFIKVQWRNVDCIAVLENIIQVEKERRNK